MFSIIWQIVGCNLIAKKEPQHIIKKSLKKSLDSGINFLSLDFSRLLLIIAKNADLTNQHVKESKKMLKKTCLLLVLLGAALFLSPKAEATVLNFDDLAGFAYMPASYGGVTWSNWLHIDSLVSPYNPSSGKTALLLWNDSPNNNMSFASPVAFDGAWFSGTTAVSENTVKFEGYLNGLLVGTSSVLVPNATPTYLSANFSSVDQVKVVNFRPDYWIMDDVTFNNGSPTNAVPEPMSISLLGIGLLGLYKRKAKA